jgi:RNA recognition motif-containing protein
MTFKGLLKSMVKLNHAKLKGFAFVEMADDAAAAKVIEELNGAEFDGRSMVVKEARPRN